MSTLSVRVCQPTDRGRWNDYVDGHGQPPLNRFEWAGIFRDVYGAHTAFLIAEDEGGGLAGALALYAVTSPRGALRVYSTRHGFLADHEAAGYALLDAARSTFPSGDHLAVTSGYSPIPCHLEPTSRTTLVIPISSPEEMWDAFRGKTRNMLRRAEKSGVRCQRGFEHLDDFYALYERHMAAMGIPLHPRAFFEAIRDAFDTDAELIVAETNGDVIGGTLVLLGADVAIYPFQTASYDHLDLAPNQAMIWEAMRLCAERGLGMLDMGESEPDGSTYRFKHNFGGSGKTVYYYDVRLSTSSGEAVGEEGAEKSMTLRRRLREFGDVAIQHAPRALRSQYYRYLKAHGRLL